MLNLPKNIYIISIVMSLSSTTTTMMILIAGLLSTQIAPDPTLATLPVAALIIGTACATIPAALIMQRIGRKAGIAVGIVCALLGAVLAYFAALNAEFWLFVVASTLMGFNTAFTQQGRFIIIENSSNEKQQADGLTLALLANLFAAILGPLIGAYGKDLIPSELDYTGSFLLISATLTIALLTLITYQNQPLEAVDKSQSTRSIWSIITQPFFILAAGSAAIGFGVMSFVMTATPISMHEINGHSLDHTTIVIQSHIVAMYLPSLLSGHLLKRGHTTSLIIAGLMLYLLVCAIAFSGQAVLHYWWALLLLGIGWNLLFITGTSMLPKAYNGNERFKAQAANDFIVFSFQALTAFSAGWVLFNLSWTAVIWIALAITSLWLVTVTIINKSTL